jgi:nitrogen regulatory protein P-II 1
LEVKLVIAVIQPTKLETVRETLEKIEVTRLTVADAQALGDRPRELDPHGREIPTGDPLAPTLLRKIALQVVVNDDFLDRTVGTIGQVARTGPEGNAGDGRIFILPAEEAIQISNGARGPGAV